MKKTIEIYERTETPALRSTLLELETYLEDIDLLIDKSKNNNEGFEELKKLSDDLEIDVHLIRMELNKRLWEDN